MTAPPEALKLLRTEELARDGAAHPALSPEDVMGV